MFRKIKMYENDSIGFGNLDLPPVELETVAFWLMPPRNVLEKVRLYGRRSEDGMLGISNSMAGVLPAHVMCDPRDIGSTVDSGNFRSPAVFIYDRFPGGVGYAEKVYEIVEDVCLSAVELISACGCQEGCPSCVGSPLPPFNPQRADTETRGAIPDKEAALCILHDLLQLEAYEPKPPGDAYALRQRGAIVDPSKWSADPAAPEPAKPLELKPLPVAVEARLRRRLKKDVDPGRKGRH